MEKTKYNVLYYKTICIYYTKLIIFKTCSLFYNIKLIQILKV